MGELKTLERADWDVNLDHQTVKHSFDYTAHHCSPD